MSTSVLSASFLTPVGLRTAFIFGLFCVVTPAVRAAEQNEPQSRGRAMMQKAEQLAKQGRVNEAEAMARHAKKLLAVPENQEQIQQLTRALEEEVARLKEMESDSARRHESDLLMEEKKQHELSHRKLDPRERKGPHGDHPPLQEAAQKLQHLRQAAEHLKAAGMTDMARQVGLHAEEIERHVHEEHTRRMRAEHDRGPDHHEREIDELRREMKELRQEVRALTERLKN